MRHRRKAWSAVSQWCGGLAALLADQGQAERARALLQPIFERFKDGSDTIHLKSAAGLLETLS